ncbi:MAG: FkbM family methyltransferase [Bacteroidetes bacterium]|nr:FkbM family methyltransferase [Bacteroidota bacterium]
MLKYFIKKPTTYAQYLQDVFVDMVFFNSMKSGYFIDIGAYDGVKFSNSYYFEKENKWQGIAVEPNEKVFKQLEKNRTCNLIKGVVTNKDGALEYLRVEGDGEMLSGIIQNFDEKHKVRIEKTTSTLGGNTSIESVQSFSIKSIIETYKVKNIDLLSIDTEGSELEILKDFPFNKIRPTIILVENNYRSNDFKILLQKHGYNFCFRLGDDVFYNKPISTSLKINILFFRILKKMNWYKIGYN